jgi:large subunit ribosomal protein L30
MTANKKIKVKLTRSLFGRTPGHRECAWGLGLRKPHQSVVIDDTPENRGMINKVSYMLIVEELA